MLYVIEHAKEVVHHNMSITPEEGKIFLMKEAGTTISQYIKLYSDMEDVLHFTPAGVPEEEIANMSKQ